MFYSQLGREGEEKKDHRLRPHAIPEARTPQVQQRFPEGHTQGREGPGEPGGLEDDGGKRSGLSELGGRHDACMLALLGATTRRLVARTMNACSEQQCTHDERSNHLHTSLLVKDMLSKGKSDTKPTFHLVNRTTDEPASSYAWHGMKALDNSYTQVGTMDGSGFIDMYPQLLLQPT